MEGSRPPYIPDSLDEALDAGGEPRPAYVDVLAELADADLERISATVKSNLRERDVNFGGEGDARPFHVDGVPRLLEAAEWNGLAFGILQRARALNRFIADAYGEQRIFEEGVIPRRVIDTAHHFEPDLIGLQAPGGHAPIVGFDLVRGADGRFGVLEENLRTPSGLSYSSAARVAVDEAMPFDAPANRRDVSPSYESLERAIRGAAPDGSGDPSAALLSDGPFNSAWFEHRRLSERLGIPIVTADELTVRSGRLYRDVGGKPTEVQVIYRRTDEDRFADDEGRPTWIADLLLEPFRAGNLGVVNAPGAGVGDDKLTHAYVSEMIRFYLRQEPMAPAVRTFDLGDPEARDVVLERLDEMVIKPRSGLGGSGIVIGRESSKEDLELIDRMIRERPDDYVAQETITLSSHPTIVGDALEPRHVDLRAFSIAGVVAPGALTRVALKRGSLIVNSSREGGAKDTWVLE
jgi:uncharacterized circularly permuted ATP-grasp superfamily protein